MQMIYTEQQSSGVIDFLLRIAPVSVNPLQTVDLFQDTSNETVKTQAFDSQSACFNGYAEPPVSKSRTGTKSSNARGRGRKTYTRPGGRNGPARSSGTTAATTAKSSRGRKSAANIVTKAASDRITEPFAERASNSQGAILAMSEVLAGAKFEVDFTSKAKDLQAAGAETASGSPARTTAYVQIETIRSVEDEDEPIVKARRAAKGKAAPATKTQATSISTAETNATAAVATTAKPVSSPSTTATIVTPTAGPGRPIRSTRATTKKVEADKSQADAIASTAAKRKANQAQSEKRAKKDEEPDVEDAGKVVRHTPSMKQPSC